MKLIQEFETPLVLKALQELAAQKLASKWPEFPKTSVEEEAEAAVVV